MKLPISVAPVSRNVSAVKASKDGVQASDCRQWCFECKVLGYPQACQIAHYACGCV